MEPHTFNDNDRTKNLLAKRMSSTQPAPAASARWDALLNDDIALEKADADPLEEFFKARQIAALAKDGSGSANPEQLNKAFAFSESGVEPLPLAKSSGPGRLRIEHTKTEIGEVLQTYFDHHGVEVGWKFLTKSEVAELDGSIRATLGI